MKLVLKKEKPYVLSLSHKLWSFGSASDVKFVWLSNNFQLRAQQQEERAAREAARIEKEKADKEKREAEEKRKAEEEAQKKKEAMAEMALAAKRKVFWPLIYFWQIHTR